MELSMLTSTSSRLTWCHTPEFTSLSSLIQSSLLKRLTMNSSPFLRSPMLVSNLLTRWSNATLATASTCLAVCSTVVMLSPRMSTQLSVSSRQRGQSNSLTGVPLVSRSESITNPHPVYLEVIWPRSTVPFACCPILQPSLKLGQDWTTSST